MCIIIVIIFIKLLTNLFENYFVDNIYYSSIYLRNYDISKCNIILYHGWQYYFYV